MATDRVNDPRALQGFLEEKLAQGGVVTLDEALSLWEYENQSIAERDLSLEAIQKGLEDIQAGRVRPAREAIAELRRMHNLSRLS